MAAELEVRKSSWLKTPASTSRYPNGDAARYVAKPQAGGIDDDGRYPQRLSLRGIFQIVDFLISATVTAPMTRW